MANNFIVADVAGQFQRGREIEAGNQAVSARQQQSQFNVQQQQKLAPIQFQQAETNLAASKQQLGRDAEIIALEKNVNSALELKSIPDNQKAEFLINKIQSADPSRDMTQSKKALELVQAGNFQELAQGTEQLLSVGQQAGIIKAPIAAPVQKLSSLQQKVAAEGLDPNTPEGQARAREITQGSRTDPSLKPSDQALLNKANEGQLASSVFANRVGAANNVLSELEAIEGFDPTSLQTAFFEAIPGGNIALSDNEQRFAQAKRDFITAVLRKESGAAIGKDEFINEDKKFFPQVGDKAAVLKQKALGRKRAFDNLKAQSKGVFDVQFGGKSGELSKAEQAELQQLRAELGQ